MQTELYQLVNILPINRYLLDTYISVIKYILKVGCLIQYSLSQ